MCKKPVDSPGKLWQFVVDRSEHALRAGAQEPIPTEHRLVEDDGVRFVVRIASNLAGKKAVSTYRANQSSKSGTGPPNPFLPYDANLFVAEISDTHVALLNKFPVVEHHLLIVTKSFECQDSPLTGGDLEAVWACMAEYDGLAFYNSGKIAGASQRHRHLQMVPLPMAPGGRGCPIDSKIASTRFAGGLGTAPGLAFPHVVATIDASAVEHPDQVGDETLETCRTMLDAAGLDVRRPAPYNLLATREWMLLVPRSHESFHAISINALGFAGSLFVGNEPDLALLLDAGPMAALAAVAGTAAIE